ncbi:hypothetical protein GKC28_04660 [Leisingera sp. ANG59]|nr:hypothetical protein [Leisingera sp. ANG59]
MSPERQKSRVYYRCQRPHCPTTTIREDRLDQAVVSELKTLKVLNPTACEKIESGDLWRRNQGRGQNVTDLKLRIGHKQASLKRLTDLVVEGVIDNSDYQKRKESLLAAIAALEEELQEVKKQVADEADLEEFTELVKNLAGLYDSSNRGEKRQILETVFSNRCVSQKNVELEPCIWLQGGQNNASVPSGDLHHHKDRTSGDCPLWGVDARRLLERLLRLFDGSVYTN